MTDWQPLAAALVAQLDKEGVLTDPGWRAAFLEVPRHVFLPDHPLSIAYEDDAVVVQTRPADVPGGTSLELPTSSASQPGVVAAMLERLRVEPGMRVLEIGTGTGYNAALLSHFLGDANVYSVDLDPDLVRRAEDALDRLGYHPTLVGGDGHHGLAAGAPYDRIVATCAISHVPPAWIRQLTGRGRIVAPLLGDDQAMIILDKTAPDEVTGRFDPYPAGFMPLRPDLDNPLPAGRHLGYRGPSMAHKGITDLDPGSVAGACADLLLFLHLHLPGLQIGAAERDDQPACVVRSATSEAEVTLAPNPDDTWTTVQRGPRRLWDTVEHAMRRWTALGRPERSRFGVTALDDPDRQYVWLDDPRSPHSWPMPL